MNVITLVLIDGVWHAVYSGPHAAQVKALFHTDTIPTPFTRAASLEFVARKLEEKNPGCLVTAAARA
jgi:hypothetical protein